MVKELLLVSVFFVPNLQTQTTTSKPLILFEKIFSNPNDAYRVSGERIDGLGRIHSFNNRNNKPGVKYREWNLGKRDFQPFTWQMTAAEVQKNLSMTDSVIGVINPDTLSKYIKMLALIDESNKNFGSTLVVCSVSGSGCKAATTATLYGFIYDSGSDMYKRVKIEDHSGVEWQNQSNYVSELNNWKWDK